MRLFQSFFGPSVPTDKRLIKAGVCVHRDLQGRPVFDVFSNALPVEQRREWRAVKRSLGLTHMLHERRWKYPDYEAITGIPKGELSYAEYRDRLNECADDGLIPCVVLPFDDDAAGAASVLDGRMERELVELLPVADRLGFVQLAWENVGLWRTKQIADSGKLARRVLGPEVLIALHGAPNERFSPASFHGDQDEGEPVRSDLRWKPYGRINPKTGKQVGGLYEDDDASKGDEIGAWFLPGIDEFDIFLFESRHEDGPTYTNGDSNPESKTWSGRYVEGFERFAPAGTFMPALGRNVREFDPRVGRSAPDWFGGVRKRGRPLCVPWELQWMEYSRNNCPEARIGDVARWLEAHGATTFGSGLPTWTV